MKQYNDIYHNKKILITGNTGFKGSWLTVWLLELGAEVFGISVNVPTVPSHYDLARLSDKITHFEGDIRDINIVKMVIKDVKPDYIFHLAAQSLVSQSYKDPLLTMQTNIMGTCNLLEAMRSIDHACNAVIITSDKCYDNIECVWGYRETDALGGKDPYSASKGGAELVIRSYARSFFDHEHSSVRLAVGRAGNVIGGGDWAPDRIVPDCIRAWSEGKPVEIRSPLATRPWQHVLEPLSGYLLLGKTLREKPSINTEPFNFGPDSNNNFTVAELIKKMSCYWEGVSWNENRDSTAMKEAGLLKLCCDKALHMLGWTPTLNFEETVQFTMDWYKYYYDNPKLDIFDFSLGQIKAYNRLMAERNGYK